jgi:hypothetical protein
MPKEFLNMNDWYWRVAGSQTQVFSSKTGDYVPLNDPQYALWSSDGTMPVNIDSEASLGELLASAVVRPTNAAILDFYQDIHARDTIVQVPFKLLFNLINDVRELKGQSRITAAQARNYIKGFM